MSVKFSVGLQYGADSFLECILKNREHIHEVYFSWGDFPNGRGDLLKNTEYTPEELQQQQIRYLTKLSIAGIRLNLLFNATCYGEESQSWALFDRIGQTVEYVKGTFGLDSITTASPLIARFVKSNFPGVATRASVNMEIGTIQGMDYLSTWFDGYYMKRELNRDFKAVEALSTWCRDNGKSLHLLANSGCLNHCSAHNFHDNLVSHEKQIARMDNAYQFDGICKEYLRDPRHHKSLIEDTNFIRPEDIGKYSQWFEAAKLATRVHRSPEYVLRSYIQGHYSGDILQLLEPAHSIYPYVLENGDPLRIVKIIP